MSLVGNLTSNSDSEASHKGVASAGAVHPAERTGSDISGDSTIDSMTVKCPRDERDVPWTLSQ